MKVATILLAGVILASPAVTLAQTAPGAASERPAKPDAVKVPRGQTAAQARAVNDTDRVIDGELRRIDRMMNICTGC